MGCEGESEASYVRLLNQTAQQNQLPVHLKILKLGGRKGDPLGRVERVCQERVKLKKDKIRLRGAAIFMDSDQRRENPERTRKACLLATENDIRLIWQEPCHEAFLLRHLPGCAKRSSATCKLAEKALQKAWPEYDKPMTMLQLSRRIDMKAIKQAARVTPEFREFLRQLGFEL